jgi:processive 1,2-diacylglycerol beta-glucosyltransferase
MASVLILTASYGSGHNAAAGALAAAFERAHATVMIVDHFRELVHPAFERASRWLYFQVLCRAPALWAAAYGLGDRISSDSPLTLGMTRIGTARLARLLATLAPDAVVTVHATPSLAMATLARSGGPVPPHTSVVTDFVAHSQWMTRDVDRYCVAAEEVKCQFVARGITPERLLVTGVPVRGEFETPVDPLEARRRLGLRPDIPVVLAMAGSDGSTGRLPEVASALAAFPRPLQGIVVAGHDSRLSTLLRRLTSGTQVRTLGYVANIRELMAASDVLVTKAGGMTLAEALAAELPMVMYGSLPGQERRNERFASRAGIALIARSRRELVRLLEELLSNPGLMGGLRRRIRERRRPDAGGRIVGAVLGLTRAR